MKLDYSTHVAVKTMDIAPIIQWLAIGSFVLNWYLVDISPRVFSIWGILYGSDLSTHTLWSHI